MSLRINLNTAAMNAHRQLYITDNELSKSMERLSSGFRINRAADDPAGLVISEKLRTQVSGLTQAMSNTTDAVNLLKTAEGALTEVHSLLRSMRDLAVHASNVGVNDAASASADQEQIKSAIASIRRIAETTQFGNKQLLDGTAGTAVSIANPTAIAGAQAVTTTPSGYVSVEVTTAATKALHDGTTNYASVGATVSNAGTITINGQNITVGATDTVSDVIAKINNIKHLTGVSARWDTNHVELNQDGYGSEKIIAYSETAEILNGGNAVVKQGVNAAATITYSTGATETFNQGRGLQLKGSSGMIINLTETGNAVATYSNALSVTTGTMTFQIGAMAGQTVQLSIPSVAPTALGLGAQSQLVHSSWTVADIDVTTLDGAQDAIKLLDQAIADISKIRGDLGAFQKNTLETNINSLGVTKENLSASESQIRDTDMASEMVKFTRNQIIMQAGTAMLAQANAVPQALLSLIR